MINHALYGSDVSRWGCSWRVWSDHICGSAEQKHWTCGEACSKFCEGPAEVLKTNRWIFALLDDWIAWILKFGFFILLDIFLFYLAWCEFFNLVNLIWTSCPVPSANFFCYKYFLSIYVMLIWCILFLRKRSYTDTSKFTLRCGVCQIGVVGQKVILALLTLAWTSFSLYDS